MLELMYESLHEFTHQLKLKYNELVHELSWTSCLKYDELMQGLS